MAPEGVTRSVRLRRQEYKAFTFAPLRDGGHHRQGLRPKLDGKRLHRSKRNHLAANFCKSFGTALERDKALGIDGHDISGIVPSIFGRLKNARIFDTVIAKHNIRTTDE